MAEMDTFDKDALAAKFGIAASVINDDPTLQAALNEIITKRIIDKDLQLAILKKTDWFQKHTEDWRKWKFYKDTNPATYKADLQANAAKIAKSYFKAGIKIDADTAIKLAEQAMQKSATVNGQVVNYNEDYFAQVMANSIDFTKKKAVGGRVVYDFGGQLEKVADSLYKTAWDYGFPATVSNQAFSKWMETNMRGLVAGTIIVHLVGGTAAGYRPAYGLIASAQMGVPLALVTLGRGEGWFAGGEASAFVAAAMISVGISAIGARRVGKSLQLRLGVPQDLKPVE